MKERQEDFMPLYVSHFAYTPETWKNLTRSPQDRTQALEELARKLGGRLVNLYYAFGEYDGLVISEVRGELLLPRAHGEGGRLIVGLALVQPLRLPQLRRRLRRFPLLAEHLAQAEVGLGQAGLQPQRLAQLGPRHVELALLLEDGGQHVVRLRVGGLAGQGLPERCGRLFRAARLPEDDAERERGLGQLPARIEREGAPQRRFRPREVVLLLEGHAEVVERLRVVGLGGRELPVDG